MAEMPDRRRVTRIVLPGYISGRVLESHEVRLLDLSPAGVRIEHVAPLRPGASCALDLPPPLGPLELTARVKWTGVRGSEQTLEGDRRLHYQSGLAFIGLTPLQQTALASVLEALQAKTGSDQTPPSRLSAA